MRPPVSFFPRRRAFVEHQQVPGRKKLRQIGEAPVGERVAGDAQQAARRADLARMLRNQLRRQDVVEVVDGKAHGAPAIMPV
jgi:hypothetical protein